MNNEIVTIDNVNFGKIYKINKNNFSTYPDFLMKGIRVIDRKHLSEIITSIEDSIDNGISLYMSPIEVNVRNMGIIDGQHRWMAAKTIWERGKDFNLEVIFREIPLEIESEIVKAKNTTQKSWSIKDYKNALEELENPDIIKLNNFCKEFPRLHGRINKKTGKCPIKDRYAMAFLKGENQTKNIKNGTFYLNDEEIEWGRKLYEEVDKMMHILDFNHTAGWFESFIQAWYRFRIDYRNVKKIEKIGIDKYIESIGSINREQVTSRDEWLDRFKAHLDNLQNKFNFNYGVA